MIQFKTLEDKSQDPSQLVLIGRFPHATVVEETLAYLKVCVLGDGPTLTRDLQHLLWDGQYWLEVGEGLDIWSCLIENAPCDADRSAQ